LLGIGSKQGQKPKNWKLDEKNENGNRQNKNPNVVC
jgi:hypothetical protein